MEGILDIYGEFYERNSLEHRKLADIMVQNNYISEYEKFKNEIDANVNPYDYLLLQGYLFISNEQVKFTRYVKDEFLYLTKEQEQFILNHLDNSIIKNYYLDYQKAKKDFEGQKFTGWLYKYKLIFLDRNIEESSAVYYVTENDNTRSPFNQEKIKQNGYDMITVSLNEDMSNPFKMLLNPKNSIPIIAVPISKRGKRHEKV